MLNLKKSVVGDYWQKTNSRLARILSVMENVEHWIVDDVQSVAEALTDVGKKMDKSRKTTLAALSEELIYAMAYISSGKFFRMIKWMDETHPGLSVHYIMDARQMQNDWAPARLMVDRIQTINSLQLIGKVFSPSRTRLIAELLRDEKRA
jgi:hypothetical protein